MILHAMLKPIAKPSTGGDQLRDLNAELREALADARQGRWARKTEFQRLTDGRVRRRITRRDGTIEKDEVIPAPDASVAAARAGTGLSQAQLPS
jgi:putative transcriptional regulator